MRGAGDGVDVDGGGVVGGVPQGRGRRPDPGGRHLADPRELLQLVQPLVDVEDRGDSPDPEWADRDPFAAGVPDGLDGHGGQDLSGLGEPDVLAGAAGSVAELHLRVEGDQQHGDRGRGAREVEDGQQALLAVVGSDVGAGSQARVERVAHQHRRRPGVLCEAGKPAHEINAIDGVVDLRQLPGRGVRLVPGAAPGEEPAPPGEVAHLRQQGSDPVVELLDEFRLPETQRR